MVLLDSAIIELSSLTASVTLGFVSFGLQQLQTVQGHSHQRVGLLLLLEDGRGRLIDLWRVSEVHLSTARGGVYIFGFASGWVPAVC